MIRGRSRPRKYLVALTGPPKWVERAGEWLVLALEHHGVGGKTRAGYGRLKLERKLTKEETELASKLRDLENLVAEQKGRPATLEQLTKLVAAFETRVDPQAVREAGRELWNSNHKSWKKYRKRHPERITEMDSVGLGETRPTPVPVDSELDEAISRLKALNNPRKIGRRVLSQRWSKLSEAERTILANEIRSWCERHQCLEQLERLVDLKGYI